MHELLSQARSSFGSEAQAEGGEQPRQVFLSQVSTATSLSGKIFCLHTSAVVFSGSSLAFKMMKIASLLMVAAAATVSARAPVFAQEW